MTNPCEVPFFSTQAEINETTTIELLFYTELIGECFNREEFPTLKEAKEWLGIQTPEGHEAIEVILERYFVKKDGVYIHERIKNYLEDRDNASN